MTKFEEILRQKGFTGAMIARELKISEANVSHWRHGKMWIPQKHRKQLSKILGVPVDELLDDRGVPKMAE
mgnify:CR=1 FL=1